MNRFFTKSKKPYFWAFLGPNWHKNIFFRKMNSSISWTMLFCVSVQKIRKILWMDFSQSLKNPIFGHFWAQIGQKNVFLKNELILILDNVILRLCTKNQENLMDGIFTKNTLLLGIVIFFFKNRCSLHVGHRHFAPLYQKSKNSYDSIPRKVGNRRANGRTNRG